MRQAGARQQQGRTGGESPPSLYSCARSPALPCGDACRWWPCGPPSSCERMHAHSSAPPAAAACKDL
jgi:hypothetical protein